MANVTIIMSVTVMMIMTIWSEYKRRKKFKQEFKEKWGFWL